MRIVVPKQQSSTLHVTKRDVLLEHCIVRNVPISPRNHKMIWTTILLRSTAPQNLVSPSSLNFVIKSFQNFTLYLNTKTPNTECRCGRRDADVENTVGDVDHLSLREELESCKHFVMDTEMENGRHRVFNFAMSSFGMSLLNGKLDCVFKELKWAAKVNLAFGFDLKNFAEGMCRYFYAHENNTIMEWSKHVCTQADMNNLKEGMHKLDFVDICTWEGANTKWKFYKLTNLTIFASLLKDVPMGYKDAVSLEPLLKNHIVNCLTFEKNTRQPYNDNLCVFRALALHLLGNEKLEVETSKIFNLLLNNSEEGDVSNF